MKYDNFNITAQPYITEAYCNNCSGELVEVSNGWFSSAMFCPKCERVFVLKLIKAKDKDINEAFLEQARKEAASKKKK